MGTVPEWPSSFQKMNQKFDRFMVTIDTVKRTLTLGKGADTLWKPVLAYERPSPTRLTQLHADLARVQLGSGTPDQSLA